MNRRELITVSAGAVASLAAQSTDPATYTYKTADSCEIKADV